MKLTRIAATLVFCTALLLCGCSPQQVQPTATAMQLSATPSPSPTPTSAPTPTPTATPTADPYKTLPGDSDAEISEGDFSIRYAYLDSVSDEGIAKLDYVDYFYGDDAVARIMRNEGLSVSEARERIQNESNGIYISNTNARLRRTNLQDVLLTVIIGADGAMLEAPQHVDAAAFLAAYQAQTALYTGKRLYQLRMIDDEVVQIVQCTMEG